MAHRPRRSNKRGKNAAKSSRTIIKEIADAAGRLRAPRSRVTGLALQPTPRSCCPSPRRTSASARSMTMNGLLWRRHRWALLPRQRGRRRDGWPGQCVGSIRRPDTAPPSLCRIATITARVVTIRTQTRASQAAPSRLAFSGLIARRSAIRARRRSTSTLIRTVSTSKDASSGRAVTTRRGLPDKKVEKQKKMVLKGGNAMGRLSALRL